MGKNKAPQKNSKKDKSVFKVAGSSLSKSKTKPKKVATNLKKINAHNRNKTNTADETFGKLRDSLLTTKKDEKATKSDKTTIKERQKLNPPPNVDEAMEEFSKL